jgi:hypothetical protein
LLYVAGYLSIQFNLGQMYEFSEQNIYNEVSKEVTCVKQLMDENLYKKLYQKKFWEIIAR